MSLRDIIATEIHRANIAVAHARIAAGEELHKIAEWLHRQLPGVFRDPDHAAEVIAATTPTGDEKDAPAIEPVPGHPEPAPAPAPEPAPAPAPEPPPAPSAG